MPADPFYVFGYSRVSTIDQYVGGHGIDAQREAIDVEVTRLGWFLGAHFTDAASGRNIEDRPALGALLDLLAAGEADALVVAKLDRLSRSMVDFARIMEASREQGWALIVLDLNVDTTTPHGQLLANVMASFAAFERDMIKLRTREALAAAKAKGIHVGRPRSIPADIVDLIHTRRSDGLTQQQIADELTRRGIPTARGGTQWRPGVISKVLAQQRRDVA